VLLCLGAALCGWLAARVARKDKRVVVWICATLQLSLFLKAVRVFWSITSGYNTTRLEAYGYQVIAVVLLVGLPLATVMGGAFAMRRDGMLS